MSHCKKDVASTEQSEKMPGLSRKMGNSQKKRETSIIEN